MKPVDQTITTVPGGNCFSACVASLLEVAIDEVPNFCSELTEDGWVDREHWYDYFCKEMRRRGYAILAVRCDMRDYCDRVCPDLYWVACGKSPRGDWHHTVVCRGKGIVHDPHPSREGIETFEEAYFLVWEKLPV